MNCPFSLLLDALDKEDTDLLLLLDLSDRPDLDDRPGDGRADAEEMAETSERADFEDNSDTVETLVLEVIADTEDSDFASSGSGTGTLTLEKERETRVHGPLIDPLPWWSMDFKCMCRVYGFHSMSMSVLTAHRHRAPCTPRPGRTSPQWTEMLTPPSQETEESPDHTCVRDRACERREKGKERNGETKTMEIPNRAREGAGCVLTVIHPDPGYNIPQRRILRRQHIQTWTEFLQ